MPANQEDQKPIPPSSVGHLESIQVSNGGVPKLRVVHPVRIGANGLDGDRQRDLRYHGGPDRAVCLLALEIIDALRALGHPIDRGTTGENLTVSGLDWSLVQTGARLAIGDVVIEITKPAHPCKNLVGSFSDGDFSRLSAKLHPGRTRMYARVIRPGLVQAGDPVSVQTPAS